MMGIQGPQRKQLSVCMYIQATVWANIYFSLLSVIFGGLNLIVAFEQGPTTMYDCSLRRWCKWVKGARPSLLCFSLLALMATLV